MRPSLMQASDQGMGSYSQIDLSQLGAGWREGPDLRVPSDTHIVVLTSVHEGTPLVLIEAMAAGKSFVATKMFGAVS